VPIEQRLVMTDIGEHTTSLLDVRMPKLSDAMEEATILEWLRQPGDRVVKGEPLVEVETDKATIVYEAEIDGLLAEIVVAAGDSAELGSVIARVTVEQEPGTEPTVPPPRQQTSTPVPAARTPVETEKQPAAREGRARATPVARRLAQELGVSLDQLAGTGPGGRIVRADVRAQAGNGIAAGVPGETGPRGAVVELPFTATQRTIAQRMSESRAQVPDFTVETEIDMEGAHRLREEWRAAGQEPLPSFNDLVVKAAALALREFPGVNAAYDDGRALRFSRINVGVAVATEDALFVPTIYDADTKSVAEIAAESRRLADKVRSRSIARDELDGGTFTISNLGMFGVRRFNAVINRPQAAILAVGEVAPRPWVTPDGGISVRRLMDVALSCDHRIVYGADAARFLQLLRRLLEDPAQLTDRDRSS
jgi:pyruvate dehydrogenase E2 component (dihydrolipoamide acetyltransferase)